MTQLRAHFVAKSKAKQIATPDWYLNLVPRVPTTAQQYCVTLSGVLKGVGPLNRCKDFIAKHKPEHRSKFVVKRVVTV